jgi:LCP family protein required for cell wall assembly
MIEDELRDVFARHEYLVPAASGVLPGIEDGYRRRRQRLRTVRIGGSALLALLVVLSSAAVADRLTPRDRPVSAPAGVGTVAPLPAGPLTFVVLGLDNDAPGPELSRSDSVLLLQIPASRDFVTMVSIERDTLVTIPADPKHNYPGGHDRINNAYALGGAALLVKTLKATWGITVDGAVTFTFTALSRLIDALGGIDFFVDSDTTSIHRGVRADGSLAVPYTFSPDGVMKPVAGVTPARYMVAWQHLTGAQAVDFARQRVLIADHGGSYSRDRHVRQLVTTVAKAATSKKVDPKLVNDMVQSALRGGAVVDLGDLALVSVLALAGQIGTVVGIGARGVPAVGPGLPSGQFEELTAPSVALLAAVKAGTVGAWAVEHPDMVDVTP